VIEREKGRYEKIDMRRKVGRNENDRGTNAGGQGKRNEIERLMK